MAGPLLNVAFDATSLATISNMFAFQPVLEQEMALALTEAGTLLVQRMQEKTWEVFSQPSGKLASSILDELTSPLELIITVNVPYAWRMEEGFVGVDSLGRHYDQQGKPYAMPTLIENEAEVAALMNTAVGEAIIRMGGVP